MTPSRREFLQNLFAAGLACPVFLRPKKVFSLPVEPKPEIVVHWDEAMFTGAPRVFNVHTAEEFKAAIMAKVPRLVRVYGQFDVDGDYSVRGRLNGNGPEGRSSPVRSRAVHGLALPERADGDGVGDHPSGRLVRARGPASTPGGSSSACGEAPRRPGGSDLR